MTNVKSDRWGFCEERGYPEMGDWVRRSLNIHNKGPQRLPFSNAQMEELTGMVKRWERVILLGEGNLRELHENSSLTRFRLEIPGVLMLSRATAGRLACTLYITKDGENSSFTVVADERAPYPRTGFQDASGNLDDIHEGLELLCNAWRAGARSNEIPAGE